MLAVSAGVRAKAGVAADDFRRALDHAPAAGKTHEALSYSNPRRLVMPIEAAKTPKTRQRRIDKTPGLLHEGQT